MHLTTLNAFVAAETLICKGASVNELDSKEQNVLFYLLGSSSNDILIFLSLFLKHEVDLNQKSNCGKYFLANVVEKQLFEVIRFVVDSLDASTKNGKATLGILIKTEEEKTRSMLKEKLGSKHFKYFDNKFLKKSKKLGSSVNSDLSSSLSQIKFTGTPQLGCKQRSCNSHKITKAETPKIGISDSAFFHGEIEDSKSAQTPDSKPANHKSNLGGLSRVTGWLEDQCDEAKINGWLDDQLVAMPSFEFKTVECIHAQPETRLAFQIQTSKQSESQQESAVELNIHEVEEVL